MEVYRKLRVPLQSPLSEAQNPQLDGDSGDGPCHIQLDKDPRRPAALVIKLLLLEYLIHIIAANGAVR